MRACCSWIGRRAGPEHNEEISDTVQAAAAEDQKHTFRPTCFALIEFLESLPDDHGSSLAVF